MTPTPQTFKTVIIGSGPAGLSLIPFVPRPVLWIDNKFTSGRLIKFEGVPSNTRVELFLTYSKAFNNNNNNNDNDNNGNNNNPLITFFPTKELLPLQSLASEHGCDLKYARDMVQNLGNAIDDPEIIKVKAQATRIEQTLDDLWMIKIDNSNESSSLSPSCSSYSSFIGKHVILATGSRPKIPDGKVPILDPESLLCPNHLSTLQLDSTHTIAVVGNSHSAILILKTLLEHTKCTIINFYRKELKYAKYLPDGRIKFDNTGLKGEAAIWAREQLAKYDEDRLIKIKTNSTNEEQIYKEWFPKLDKIVWAIGYERNPLPIVIDKNGKKVDIVDYDSEQRLLLSSSSSTLAMPSTNLYGIGIAFPERVIDPSGEQELNVGLYKFLKSSKKLGNFINTQERASHLNKLHLSHTHTRAR